jgi:hypothetical protein
MFAAEDNSNVKQKDIPRPYVFRSDNFETKFEKGQSSLKAELIVFHKLIPLMPYLIHAMNVAADRGFGAHRIPFKMTKATLKGTDKILIYDEKFSSDLIKPFELLPPWDFNNIRVNGMIEIDTPLFLKDKKSGKCKIKGNNFLKSLIRRASALSRYYADDEWKGFPFSSFFRELENVEILSSDLRWCSFSRYSSTQGGEFPVKGYVGKIVLNNIPVSLLELLTSSEHIHLGKGAAWGLGKIRTIGFF